MPKIKDITGQKFNRLTAIKRISKNKYNQYLWLFKCDCGKEKIIIASKVTSNLTKSCGCLNKEQRSKNLSTYMLNRHPEHIEQTISLGRKSGERIRTYQKEGRMYPNNTSGVTGVSYDKNTKTWVARLQYHNQSFRQRYKTYYEAVRGRKNMEKELGIYTEDGIKAFGG